MSPGDLDKALCGLELPSDPRLLRGLEGNEDAGVYLVSDDLALVQTVDILTPIHDDPWVFGRIAAANALSDVYAMGGRPLTVLNIVCFPVQDLGVESLRRLIEGGLSAIVEAGALLVGGHSIKSVEPKYGLAVTGSVHPDELMVNSGLVPGQVIILTKPIGTGVISGANKSGLASPESVAAMVESMSRLNARAAALAADHGVRAASDVTGFGLAGHLIEMLRASKCAAELYADEVPLLPGALEHARAGRFPGGSKANRTFFSSWTTIDDDVDEELVGLLFDAQTSGGLLLGVPAERAAALQSSLRAAGEVGQIVGRITGTADAGALRLRRQANAG